jgi:guanylate kinase
MDRLGQLKQLGLRAVPLVPQLVAAQQARFLERWREAMALTDGTTLPEGAQDRALTEATAFAIRIDVAEELTRLNSHLDEIERLVGKGGNRQAARFPDPGTAPGGQHAGLQVGHARDDPHLGRHEGSHRADARAGSEHRVNASPKRNALNRLMDYPGNLFVVAAPSGAGKSSLVKALMELDSGVQPSVSHTTRPPRGQEKHGREYFFVSEPEFDAMVLGEAFVEWAHVHGRRYGTSRKAIEDRIATGADVVLEIDFQGAIQIKRIFSNAVLIFILPPSWEELRSRLERRGEDAAEVIELRLRNAEKEMRQVREFDFVIINELFERALFDLKAIVHAQRLKYTAQRRARADTFKALNID